MEASTRPGAALRVLFGAFLRDLRWMVPLAVAPMPALWLLDVGGVRDLSLLAWVWFGVAFLVVLGPLGWLRFTHAGRHDAPFWIFLALSALWAVVSLTTVLILIRLLGID